MTVKNSVEMIQTTAHFMKYCCQAKDKSMGADTDNGQEYQYIKVGRMLSQDLGVG